MLGFGANVVDSGKIGAEFGEMAGFDVHIVCTLCTLCTLDELSIRFE